jgi:hypothetical protein
MLCHSPASKAHAKVLLKDQGLIQIVDSALADAARRSGEGWSVAKGVRSAASERFQLISSMLFDYGEGLRIFQEGLRNVRKGYASVHAMRSLDCQRNFRAIP